MRYSRQTQVDAIGQAGQAALSKANILIVGAGGLGCTVATQLAGAGVGHISIVDHDEIDITNLHRQSLYREADIGQPKAEIAAQEMRRINSDIKVMAVQQRLSPANVGELCHGKTIIIDAADNFATSYLLSDTCCELAVPLITASVNRTFGYVGQFCGHHNKPLPSLRVAFPRLPKEQTSCDTVGVTGPSVGAIASIQAQEALKTIIGDDSQLAGKLLYLDLWNYSQHIIDLTQAPQTNAKAVHFIGESDINDQDTVFDVRSKQEITDAPFTFPNVVTNLQDVKPEQRIVCACRSGQRALVAAQQLLDDGYSNVVALMPK